MSGTIYSLVENTAVLASGLYKDVFLPCISSLALEGSLWLNNEREWSGVGVLDKSSSAFPL